jgi:uncharacterized coiled-coil protein SlyX
MSTSDWIAISGIAIGFFVAIIGSVWHLSASISGLAASISGLAARVTAVEKTLATVVTTVTEIRIETAEMQVKLDILWKAHVSKSNSPIVLNEVGEEILAKSSIGSFAEQYYLEILSRVRSFTPENAYQAQEILISIMDRYKKDDRCKLRLQEVAFSSGYDVSSLLFVAALFVRDRVISDLGFAKNVPHIIR